MLAHKFEILLGSDEEKAAVLTLEEFKRLKREALYGRNGIRNLAIIYFSFFSALRVTELAKLKIKDVIDRDGSIKEQFRLPSAYTKNKESRWAYILEQEHQGAIKDYLKLRYEKRRRVSDKSEYLGMQADSPLFLARGNSGFTYRIKEYKKADGTIANYSVCASLQQLLSDLVKTVTNKGASSHSGRRTFATRLAERGVDLEFIKYFLGHKSKQQTLAYIDSDPKKGRMILKNIYGEF